MVTVKTCEKQISKARLEGQVEILRKALADCPCEALEIGTCPGCETIERLLVERIDLQQQQQRAESGG